MSFAFLHASNSAREDAGISGELPSLTSNHKSSPSMVNFQISHDMFFIVFVLVLIDIANIQYFVSNMQTKVRFVKKRTNHTTTLLRPCDDAQGTAGSQSV